MAVTQLSVFLKNKAGVLSDTIGRISDAGINIRALSIADTADFGILRIIVEDIPLAKKAIGEHAIVTETHVIAIKMDDRSGSLYSVLKVLDEAGINVEYIYAFTSSKSGTAYVVIRVNDHETAEPALIKKGFETLDDAQLQQLF